MKNISRTGVQLKVYTQPLLAEEAILRVADELPVKGSIVWAEGDAVGLNLDDELDASTLLRVQQKLRPNRRRAIPRISVEASALLRSGGRSFHATVCDVSSLGARLRSALTLKVGDKALVQLRDLPSIHAYVRWADGNEAGLIFQTPIPMEIIAHWVDGRARAIA